MNKFKENFLVGAATAAHQVEGNNLNNDCWLMENIEGSMYKEPSLDAVDHYNRYEEDIKLMAKAGLNAYRFSIEWARIEPQKGKYDDNEIEHYREVLNCCYQNEITPIVTLHHFSSPVWLIKEGGWESEKIIEHFVEYCKYVVVKLGDLMPYVCTINEANMGLQITKLMKKYMGQSTSNSNVKSQESDVQVGLNMDTQSIMQQYYIAVGQAFGMDPRNVNVFLAPRTKEGDEIVMKCHQKASEAIKRINSEIKIGVTLSLYDHQALPGGESSLKREQEEDFLHYLPYLAEDDFIGVQNYTRKVHGPDGVIYPDNNTRVTQMGNEYYPEALENVVRFVSEHWDKPIMVTENGIATEDDSERIEFMSTALTGLTKCIEDGIDIVGYMHWSLLDNFEWQKGYAPKFGLIEVDRRTQKRLPKESLSYLGNIVKSGI